MPSGRNTRMQQWINYRVRVTLQDARLLVGTFLAFDRHMNVVLADCEEFRRVKQRGVATTSTAENTKEVKRPLGFVMLRGENIVSLTAEAPPSQAVRQQQRNAQAAAIASAVGMIDPNRAPHALPTLPGRAMPTGRGFPIAPMAMAGVAGATAFAPPPGLAAGPVRGLGGPAPAAHMLPHPPQLPPHMVPHFLGGVRNLAPVGRGVGPTPNMDSNNANNVRPNAMGGPH